jgi:SAM-dependent methyltransferase
MHLSTQPTACRRGRWFLLLTFFCLGSLLLRAADLPRQANVATNRYEFHQPHDPAGIGKFYMGREIAQVMGHEAADWLERPERDTEEHTEVLVEQLKLKPGETIADIGAGTGYFSRRLAIKVGATGKVLAVDIQPEMLLLLTNRMAAVGITNVVPILGSATDPKLPAASVDLVLLVDMYHEFDFPVEVMEALCRSVKPGGRVVFVEYRGEDPAVPIKPLHKMTEMQVKREMSALPLDWVQTIEVLPRQHIIIFRKRWPGSAAASGLAPFQRFI